MHLSHQTLRGSVGQKRENTKVYYTTVLVFTTLDLLYYADVCQSTIIMHYIYITLYLLIISFTIHPDCFTLTTRRINCYVGEREEAAKTSPVGQTYSGALHKFRIQSQSQRNRSLQQVLFSNCKEENNFSRQRCSNISSNCKEDNNYSRQRCSKEKA